MDTVLGWGRLSPTSVPKVGNHCSLYGVPVPSFPGSQLVTVAEADCARHVGVSHREALGATRADLLQLLAGKYHLLQKTPLRGNNSPMGQVASLRGSTTHNSVRRVADREVKGRTEVRNARLLRNIRNKLRCGRLVVDDLAGRDNHGSPPR